MAYKGNLLQLSDLCIDSKDRPGKAVYFVRMDQWNENSHEVLKKCIQKAQKCGMLLDNKLPAPQVEQIQQYQNIVGDALDITLPFFDQALAKWLPQISQNTRNTMSDALLRMLTLLKKSGKNINILKNACIKYMCWAHDLFLPILKSIDKNDTPMVIYDSGFSIYEIQMLMILCYLGCDVVLLYTQNDDYQKIDPDQQYAQYIEIDHGKPYLENNTIRTIVKTLEQLNPIQTPRHGSTANPIPTIPSSTAQHPSVSAKPQTSAPLKPLVPPHPPKPSTNGHAPGQPVSTKPTQPQTIDFGPEPRCKLITNCWCTSPKTLANILTPFAIRSANPQEICNIFALESGVSNISTYENDLYQFYRQMIENKRRVIITSPDFEPPRPDEVSNIRRGNYNCVEGMIKGLSTNIVMPGNADLQKLAIRAFGDVILEYATQEGIGLPDATRTAIYLIIWLRRCQKALFEGWNPPNVGCLIYLGACTKEKEALFLRMLARMPVDVLMLNPNLDQLSNIQDRRLDVHQNASSMSLEKFPTDRRDIRITTEGYQAEQELNHLTDDYGIYRSQQFKQAESFTLQTSYYEIVELWDTPITERPNFEIDKGIVRIPTLFSKISGVEQDKEENYWLHVKSLMTPHTHVIKQLPNMTMHKLSPITNCISDLYINHRLQRDRIRTHRLNPYTLLRPDMQEHILNAIETMLARKLIRGTGERNTDFTIIAAALSLDKPIQRLLQQFDFTQKNPKILVINTGETVGSIQDAIQFAFLNLIGFDVLFFVPSGYQCVEQWYQTPLVTEHYAGTYQYQYKIPDFERLSNTKQSWFNKLIRN